MVIIEESENFHPRRKMISLKMMAFLENFLVKNTLHKSYEGTQNFRFIAAVVKKLVQLESGCWPKSPLPGIGLRGAPLQLHTE